MCIVFSASENIAAEHAPVELKAPTKEDLENGTL